MKKNYALSIIGCLLAAGTFAQSCSLELVPNGGFESGISLSNFENFPIYQDFANHPSNVTSWHAYKGLPDLCVRGSIKTQEPFTPIPAQGIPLNAYNTFYSNVGAINTHNGSPNNRYIMLQEDEGPNCEGLYTELVIAPDRKKSYTLNAWAINIHDSREQDAYLIFKLHNANPVTGSPSISHTVGTVFVGDANGGSNPWTSISISIPAFSLPVGELKYLTVETKNLNYEFEPSANLVFIDDISIFDADAVAGGTLTNFGTYTCPGTSVLMSLQGSWGNIQWQRRPCNGVWTNIPGSSTVLQVTTINTSLQYYYRAKLTSCNGVIRYSN
ncbi:MAG: hypothetical protein KDD36_10130, partial [Flavobacteriales bacterium]|nr:hypothetical protein [Flavobacteriales bacterium]